MLNQQASYDIPSLALLLGRHIIFHPKLVGESNVILSVCGSGPLDCHPLSALPFALPALARSDRRHHANTRNARVTVLIHLVVAQETGDFILLNHRTLSRSLTKRRRGLE